MFPTLAYLSGRCSGNQRGWREAGAVPERWDGAGEGGERLYSAPSEHSDAASLADRAGLGTQSFERDSRGWSQHGLAQRPPMHDQPGVKMRMIKR